MNDPVPLAAAPAISITGLTRYYGTTCVVDRLSLDVPEGTILGFLGRNGAGKTTTIRMLLGLMTPTRGRSTVLGCDSQALTPGIRARIGHLAETHPVYEWMTVGEHGRFHAAGHDRWRPQVFAAAIDHFGLTPSRKLRHLSRGQRAGVCLAAVLATDPDLLVLDDPALGLDPLARQDLLDALLYLVRRERRTVLFSSHHLADVDRVADRIAVLDQGRLLALCPPEDFRTRIRRVVLGFAGEPPPLPATAGILQIRRSSDQLDVVLLDRDPEALAATLGARHARELPLSLEESFNAYVAPRRERGSLSATLGAAS